MTESETKVGTAIGSEYDEHDNKSTGSPAAAGASRTAAREPAHAAGGGLLHIIKPGQGTKVRWGTAIGAGALAVAGAEWIYTELQAYNFGAYDLVIRTMIPVILLLAAVYGIFVVVGRRPSVVDFLIATEGEMKKVNWSTRKEVWGATKVVIVTVLALGIVLAVVDAIFMLCFGAIGVLKNVPLLSSLINGSK